MLSQTELVEILGRLGVRVGVDAIDVDGKQRTYLAHALLGAVEAQARRSEAIWQMAGASSAQLQRAALASTATNEVASRADELALLAWRAHRLRGALVTVESPRAPTQRPPQDNDRLVAAAALAADALAALIELAGQTGHPEHGSAAESSLPETLDKLEAATAMIQRLHQATRL